MRRIKLDRIDRRILQNLQADGRMTNVELARRVGISAPPCLRRVRALEEAGLIRGYHAELAPEALGFAVTVFAQVGLASQAEADLKAFEELVATWPEVREAHMLAGETDFLLKIVAHRLGQLSALSGRQADLGAQCQPRQIGADAARLQIRPGRADRRRAKLTGRRRRGGAGLSALYLSTRAPRPVQACRLPPSAARSDQTHPKATVTTS